MSDFNPKDSHTRDSSPDPHRLNKPIFDTSDISSYPDSEVIENDVPAGFTPFDTIDSRLNNEVPLASDPSVLQPIGLVPTSLSKLRGRPFMCLLYNIAYVIIVALVVFVGIIMFFSFSVEFGFTEGRSLLFAIAICAAVLIWLQLTLFKSMRRSYPSRKRILQGIEYIQEPLKKSNGGYPLVISRHCVGVLSYKLKRVIIPPLYNSIWWVKKGVMFGTIDQNGSVTYYDVKGNVLPHVPSSLQSRH